VGVKKRCLTPTFSSHRSSLLLHYWRLGLRTAKNSVPVICIVCVVKNCKKDVNYVSWVTWVRVLYSYLLTCWFRVLYCKLHFEQVIGKLLSLGDGMQTFTEVIADTFMPYYSRVECHSSTVILHPQETENVHPFDNEGKPLNTPCFMSIKIVLTNWTLTIYVSSNEGRQSVFRK